MLVEPTLVAMDNLTSGFTYRTDNPYPAHSPEWEAYDQVWKKCIQELEYPIEAGYLPS